MAVRDSAGLRLHDKVRLDVPKDGFKAGTPGAIVDAYPEKGRFTVELFDDDGETLDLVECLTNEIRRLK